MNMCPCARLSLVNIIPLKNKYTITDFLVNQRRQDLIIPTKDYTIKTDIIKHHSIADK